MSVRHSTRLLGALACSASLLACGGEGKGGAKGDSSAATVAAAAAPQKTKGDITPTKTVVWTPLVDAKLSQWRAWKADTMTAGWTVTGDTMSKDGIVSDLESRAQYANFELEFDWKVGKMANAGVFYRVTEEYDKPYWSAPEYQLRDDAMDPKGENQLLASASVYGLLGPPFGVSKPQGEWNTARIVVAGNFVEHWLNGQQVVQYQLGSPDWAAKVKATKFNDYPNFSLAKRGFIAIQGDHQGMLSIRGMRIRELP